jgi:hypothetical protein
VIILFSSILLLNNGDYFEKRYNYNNNNNNIYNIIDFVNSKFLQNSYAVEEDAKDKDNDNNNDDNSEDKKDKSIFNFAAVGDWDCTGETEDTVDNIVDQEPELVLALGDLSYNGKADCWLDLIEPIVDKTKIVIGNHEEDLIKDYKDFFGLKEQYYSFNLRNIHFLALSTQGDYDEESEQYKFAIRDLEKYSNDPFFNWIIVFYHHFIYGSGSGLPEEDDFREIYHPLFDKYKVDLALQGHLHVYERTYPITYNDEDDDEPIVQDYNPNIYKKPKGPIFVTVGTGGAHDMILSSSKDYSALGIDGKFGILDIALVSDQKTLTGTFIENGKKKEVMDEFKIIKED